MLVEFAKRYKFKVMKHLFQEATEQTMDMDLSK